MWASLEQETSLIATWATSPRVAVETLGESVQGRPIRLLRVGNPAPGPGDRATLLLTGCVHGNEPAGREAILNLLEYLTTTDDTTTLAWLADNPVWLIPTVNPDGFDAGTRNNANDVDLNRDFVSLEEPESRAVAVALGRARPLVMVDLHESVNLIDPGNDVEVNAARPAQAHQNIKDLGVELRDLMLDRATAEGWPNGVFGSTVRGDLRLLDINSALRHSVACIVETNFSDDSTSGREHRLEIHDAMVEEIWSWVTGNTATIAADVQEAIDDKIAEGEAGVAPFDLRDGGTLDPPPLGYRLSGQVPSFHLHVYNISVSAGAVVSMGQAAQPIIPYLLDPASPYVVAPGVRLWTLPAPVVVATVKDFAPVVSGSHTLLTHVRLVTGFPTGYDPDGVDVPVRSGTVELDATADVFATLDLEIPGVDPATGRPWFPRRSVDPLAPYGAELFVRVGVDLGDRTLWSTLGYFRIDDLDQPDAPDGPIRIAGSDRMAGVIDARLVEPMEFGRSATYAQVVTALVQDAHPLALVVFDDDSGGRTIGRQLIVEEDRYEALRDLAESLGKLVWWDGEGILRVADAPDATVPVWHVRAGRHGVLVSAQRRVTRQGIYNAVVAQGEATSGTPARAVVVDDGPRSPTRWGGPFGKVPRFYSSPLLTTQGQARAAAASILRRSLGMPYSVSLGAVTNPALRPHDPIRVTLRDGSRDLHIVDTMSIPLTAGGGSMQLSTRSMADVRLGELDG